MRTNVTFKYPVEFVPLSDEGGILTVMESQWFAALLRRVPGLEIDEDLCQEDWGVVLFARRSRKKFWIGLSTWDEGAWLAHVHHGSFAWLQWFTSSGAHELMDLLAEVHMVLASEAAISEIAWYKESEMCKAQPEGFPTPFES